MPDRRHETLRVAVAQLATELGHVEANVDAHITMIEQAREAGVQCLLFPEMSLTGHSAGAVGARHRHGSEAPSRAKVGQ